MKGEYHPIIFRHQLPVNMPIGGSVSLPFLTTKYDINKASVKRNTETEFTVELMSPDHFNFIIEITPDLILTAYVKE